MFTIFRMNKKNTISFSLHPIDVFMSKINHFLYIFLLCQDFNPTSFGCSMLQAPASKAKWDVSVIGLLITKL